MTQPQNDEDLAAKAKQRMENMPAETALGNLDAQGSGIGDPEQYLENAGTT